ncbi:Aste57867_1519 [Aphanomyces stellatus]|uniref:Aste57867_1519 protein n=1 Tax=Aphanomyces stellatus TaxID=120398 RepID=A0A485K814_9STRA|nr:hypothetical protein As57867_001518 [Aphanomyces stellatus]VFT78735.1 Aste57867_1519 [Aphanomyces stellatus]
MSAAAVPDKLAQCAADFKTPTQVLSAVSLGLSFLTVVFRLLKKRQCPFPENLMTLSCGFACVVSLVMFLNTFVDSREDVPSCRVKGLVFQAAVSMMLWHWILHMAVLYLVLVRNVSDAALSIYRSSYYSCLFCVPVVMLSVGLTRNHYGADADTAFCWMPDGVHRFTYLYSQLLLGLVVFLGLVPSICLAKTTMMRTPFFPDVVFVLYLGLVSMLLLVDGINGLLPLDNAFLLHSAYGTCALHRLHLATVGTIAALLAQLLPAQLVMTPPKTTDSYVQDDNVDDVRFSPQSPPSRQSSRPPSRATFKSSSLGMSSGSSVGSRPASSAASGHISLGSTSTTDVQNNLLLHRRGSSSSSVAAPPPPDHRLSLNESKFFKTEDFCKSAFDSDFGATMVSVPPEHVPQRALHDRAMEAYSHMVLGHVREQLQAEGYDISSRQMSTFLSTLERSILTGGSNVLDTKLHQMLDDYRRENHTLLGDEMTTTTSISMGQGAREGSLLLNQRLAAAQAVFDHAQQPSTRSTKSAKNVSFGGSTAMHMMPAVADEMSADDDLDAQLAAARARFFGGSQASSGDYDEDEDDDGDY